MPAPPGSPAESVAQQIQTLEKALRQARCTFLLIALMLAAVVGIGLYAHFEGERVIKAKEQEIVAATEREVAAHSDTLLDAAGDIATDNFPPLAEAFARQFQQDMPEYMRLLDTEGDRLNKNLEGKLREPMEARYRAQMADFRGVLKEEFPGETDPKELDRMMDLLRKAVERLAERYYVSEFSKQTKELKGLWTSIPPAEPVQGGPTLDDQLKQSVQDWVLAKFLEGGLRSRPRGPMVPKPEGK